MTVKIDRAVRLFGKLPTVGVFLHRAVLPSGIRFLHALLDFKQPSTPGDTVAFEGRRDGKADGLIRPAFICNNKVCVQRLSAAPPALHGGVEGFQVDCDVSALLHLLCLRFLLRLALMTFH